MLSTPLTTDIGPQEPTREDEAVFTRNFDIVGGHIDSISQTRTRAEAVDDRVAVGRTTDYAIPPKCAVPVPLLVALNAITKDTGGVNVDLVIGSVGIGPVVVDQELGGVMQATELATAVDVEGDGRGRVGRKPYSTGLVRADQQAPVGAGLEEPGGGGRPDGGGDGAGAGGGLGIISGRGCCL